MAEDLDELISEKLEAFRKTPDLTEDDLHRTLQAVAGEAGIEFLRWFMLLWCGLFALAGLLFVSASSPKIGLDPQIALNVMFFAVLISTTGFFIYMSRSARRRISWAERPAELQVDPGETREITISPIRKFSREGFYGCEVWIGLPDLMKITVQLDSHEEVRISAAFHDGTFKFQPFEASNQQQRESVWHAIQVQVRLQVSERYMPGRDIDKLMEKISTAIDRLRAEFRSEWGHIG